MQAIAYTAYGGPEVTKIVTVPIPSPAPGEIQVRVAGVGLNPIDWHQRRGELRMIHPQTLPVIGGNEFSGVVTALGEGVTNFAVGDKAICRCVKTKWQALARYVTMPASIVAKAPASIDLVDASGLPLAGLTALQALDELKVANGDKVLITGGAGGVGQFAIQLAKLRGAVVTTTASSAGKEVVERAGADKVVDYRSEKPLDSGPYDKVFDTVGGEKALTEDVVPAVKSGGTVVSVGGPQTPGCLDSVLSWWKATLVNLVLRYRASAILSAAASHGVTYRYIFMHPDGGDLQQLSELVDQGSLRIPVDARFSFQEYAKAFERLESGRAKGKVIIDFGSIDEPFVSAAQ